MPVQLKVQLHYPNMSVPAKAHDTDAGFDLTCMDVVDKGNRLFFIDTGVSLEPPTGYYVELYPRSSICRINFFQANSVGIIDSDYRGRLFMPFRYLGQGDGLAEARDLLGKRVGQLILKRQESVEIELCADLSDTARGNQGFGSSGV